MILKDFTPMPGVYFGRLLSEFPPVIETQKETSRINVQTSRLNV